MENSGIILQDIYSASHPEGIVFSTFTLSHAASFRNLARTHDPVGESGLLAARIRNPLCRGVRKCSCT